jgi:hypothetical protein
MQDQIRNGSLILGIAIVLGLASLGYLLGDAASSVKALERTVTVKGLSEREVSANIAIWPVTFQVASNNLDEVYNAVEDNSRIIKRFLAAYGIAEGEISLSPPSVSDLYAQQWGDKQYIKFRYIGSASVTVYSENVAAVREAMSNVVELGKQGVAVGGAPNQTADRFLFTKLSELKPEMIEEATKNARSVAEKFAQDSASRLGKIKSASQGQFSIVNRDSTTPHIKKVRVVSTIEYYLSD